MKKYIAVLATLFFSLTATIFADETFDNLFNSKKYKDAIEYADQTIPAVSRTADIWVKLGIANEKLGMTEKALACFMVSSRMNPNDYGSLFGAARIYNKLSQPSTAMEMAKRALEQNFTGEASWEYARACIALKRPADAKKALEKVIETDSANVVANRELGRIYFDDKEYEKALPLLGKAYYSKKDGDVAYKIAKCYLATGNSESAVKYLKMAVSDKPSLNSAKLDLARTLYKIGNFSEASKTYESISGKIKFKSSDYYNMAVAFEKINKIDKSIKYYRLAIKKFGSSKSSDAISAREKVGRYDLNKKQYASSLVQLKFIKNADPKAQIVKDLYFLLADAYMGQNNSKQAIASLETAISINGNDIEAYARLADLYAKNNMQAKAKATYEKLMSLRPDDPNVYLILGNYNFKAKKYSEALNLFVKCNTIQKSKDALQGIALSAKALGQWEKARDAAESALGLDNTLIPSHIVLYEATFRDKLYAQSVKHLEFLVDKYKGNVKYWKDLATCYEKIGDTEKLASADKVINSLDRKNSISRKRLAKYLLAKKDVKGAYPLFKELAVLTPNDAMIFKNLYEIALNNSEKTVAIRYLKKYLALNSADADAYKILGDLLYEKKQYDGALSAYRTTIKLDPTIKGFYKRYAEIVIAKGQTDEVIKALKGVVNSGEGDVSTFLTLGQIYQKKKWYKSATEMFQKALQLDPQNIDALVSLADCQAATGNISSAVISYEQAVMMNPKARDEYKALGDLYKKQKKYEQANSAYRKFIDKGGRSSSICLIIGKDAFNKKDYVHAAKYLKLVKGKSAKVFNNQLILGESLFKSGAYNEAIVILKALILRNPRATTKLKLTKMIAESYEKLNKPVLAITYYSKYIAMGAYDADAAYKRAFLEEKNNNTTKAISHYIANTKKYPKDYRNYLQLGLLYSKNKATLKKSAYMLKKAVATGPAGANVWIDIANVYKEIGNKTEELNALKKYIDSDPQNIDVNIRIGILLIDSGKIRDGMVFLETANTLSPNNIKIMIPLATAYMKTNRSSEAITILSKAKAMNKDNIEVLYLLYKLYKKTGNLKSAKAEIEDILKIKRDSETLLLYAKLLFEDGKYKDAENTIEDIRATNPENIDALMTLGKIQRARKKYDDAIETYKEVIYIDAKYAPAIFERAEVYMAQNKPQWAQKFYERALRTNPKCALAELGLGKVAKLRKNMTSYAEHVRKAYKLDPKNPVIKDAYNKLK